MASAQSTVNMCDLESDCEEFEQPHPKKKRFKVKSVEEIDAMTEEMANKNTIKQEQRAQRAFEYFLKEAGADSTDFWLYPTEDLDQWLGKFYIGARKEDGELYKLSSMTSLRYGLQRVLNKKGLKMDILKSAQFKWSQHAFSTASTELVKEGKGGIVSAAEISEAGKYNSRR